MLAGLTAAERPLLNDPDFITEDEAHLIMSDRSMNEPGVPVSLDDLLRENGQPGRKRVA